MDSVSCLSTSLFIKFLGMYLVRFYMSSEADVQFFHGALHSLAVAADNGYIEYSGGFGYIGDVLADVKFGEVALGRVSGHDDGSF